MNCKGGYCTTRYGGCGGGVGMYGLSKVENIMLKFRPIAPKPFAAGSGGSTTDEYVKCGRSKRKYVRVNKNRKRKDNFKRCGEKKRKVKAPLASSEASPAVTLPLLPERRKVKPPLAASFEAPLVVTLPLMLERKKVTAPPAASFESSPVVTLPLLPETPDRKENKPSSFSTGSLSDLVSHVPVQQNKKAAQAPLWLSFNGMASQRRPQVVSKVTVECVTDTWVETERCTDAERVMNMEKDTCPGFISDGQDRVVWTNKAYKEMAGVGHVVDGEDIAVVLVRKDKLTPSPVTFPAFTCKVRVSSASNSLQQTPSPSSPTLTLPCDVWRMERGACAWRLDVKAALSLGR